MKKAIIYFDCCRDCPFSDKIISPTSLYELDKIYCDQLDKVIEALKIDKNCPLEDD